MNEFIEILKYTAPSLIILIAVYFIIQRFIGFNTEHLKVTKMGYELEHKKLETELKLRREESVIPLKLQAFERLTLFLERISPPNLVVREMEPEMNAGQFHAKLLNVIRDEYEHNMSQQVYLSQQTWGVIKNAKEEIMSLINNAAGKIPPSAPAVKLGEEILSYVFEKDKDPVNIALASIKNEMKNTFI
jgi:hypothetical protein